MTAKSRNHAGLRDPDDENHMGCDILLLVREFCAGQVSIRYVHICSSATACQRKPIANRPMTVGAKQRTGRTILQMDRWGWWLVIPVFLRNMEYSGLVPLPSSHRG